jgi:hypothetical protein
MFKLFVSLGLAFSLILLVPCLGSAETVQSGTTVRLRFLNGISSEEASEGQGVSFVVVGNVVDPETQRVLIRAGAPASGSITRINHRGIAGKKGELGLTIHQTEAVDGSSVPLSATMDSSGRGTRGTAIGLTAVGALIFLPLMLFIFKKGKEAKIPAGSEINAYVVSDVKVNASKAAVAGEEAAVTDKPANPDAESSYIRELEQLDNLVKKGILTPEEFEQKKRKLLGL